MVSPIVVDIDGTLTRPNVDVSPAPIDPRVFDPLYRWPDTVILATGKAFPFPVALGQFIGLERTVIAENGGLACVGNELNQIGDGAAARAVEEAMADRGHPSTVDQLGFINRWRETEVAFTRDVPFDVLDEVATEHGLHVVDTGYAYHVKDATVTKGRALEWVVDQLDRPIKSFVAIGDSINDVSLFDRVGTSFAVANADGDARAAADHVTVAGYAPGLIEALEQIRDR